MSIRSHKAVIFIAIFLVQMLLLIKPTVSFGQATCTTSASPAVVRSQGLTELAGGIVLFGCDGTIPTSGATLQISLSPATTFITNNPALSLLPTAVVTTTSGGVTTVAAPISGVIVRNVISFSIPATPGGSKLASIQIGSIPGNPSTNGIRINVASSGVVFPSQISAQIAVTGSLTLFPNSVNIAIPFPGLFNSITPGAAIFQGTPPVLNAAPLTAAYTAGAAPSFIANDPITGQPINASSVPIVSALEGLQGTFLVAGAPPAGNGEGADSTGGTRVLIRFTDIPANIAVYAPQVVSTTTVGGSLTMYLVVGADNNGTGGIVIAAPSATTANLATGTSVTYETISSATSVSESVNIPFGLFTTGVPSIGSFSPSVYLAPVSTSGTSVSAPIPRFAEIASPRQTAAGPPTIGLSSTSFNFTSDFGSTSSPQTLSITNTGGSTLNWTAAISSINGGNWLTISPTSGSGDGNVNFSVSSSTLAVGNYSATVTIAAPGATNTPLTVTITAIVNATTLTVDPPTLTFTGPVGSIPPSQQLRILTGGGILNWTANTNSAGGNWLKLSPVAGTTPTLITVFADTTGLGAGNYQGSILFSALGSSNSVTVNVTLVVGTPLIALSPSSIIVTASRGVNPPPQSISVQNSGAGVLGWNATSTTQSGGNWLSIGPVSGTAPSTITATINSAALPAGAYIGTVTVSALAGSGAPNSPQIVPITLLVDAPSVAAQGIVNAASYSKDGVFSPNTFASLFGSNLSSTTTGASTAALPTTLGGTQVLVNEIPAPLSYVSSGQINFVIPPGVTGASAQVVVVSNGVRGAITQINIAAATPGIFSADFSGGGQGAILNQDSSLNSVQNPALSNTVVQIYMTGLGATTPPAVSGQPAGTSPLSTTQINSTVTIGGIQAELLFSGLAPGFVGAYQLNVRIPAGVVPGNAVPVVVQAGGRTSNTVTLAIR